MNAPNDAPALQTALPEKQTLVCPFSPPDWVAVGVVQGSHGLRGTLKLKTYDEHPDWVSTAVDGFMLWPDNYKLQKQHLQGLAIQPKQLKNPTPHKVLLDVEGFDSTEAVAPWVKAVLFVPRQALPKVTEPDTYRTIELVGLTVIIEETQEAIGTVSGVLSSSTKGILGASQDYLEISYNLSGKTGIVPFVGAFVGEVDLAQKTINLKGLTDFLTEENRPAPPKVKKPTPYQRKKLRTASSQEPKEL
jgi:16S rRNA processing protein RimM